MNLFSFHVLLKPSKIGERIDETIGRIKFALFCLHSEQLRQTDLHETTCKWYSLFLQSID